MIYFHYEKYPVVGDSVVVKADSAMKTILRGAMVDDVK
jgi:hypothetical protein